MTNHHPPKSIKRATLALLLALVAVVLLAVSPTAHAQTNSVAYQKLDEALTTQLSLSDALTPLEVVVVFDEMSAVNDISSLATNFYAMTNLPMAGAILTKAQIEEISSWPQIKSITLNAQLDHFLVESIPYIGADRVWTEFGQTGGNATVAVIDSGIDASHPDVLFGYQVVQNVKVLPFGDPIENVISTDNSSSHGTHVAGTIAGGGMMSDGHYKGVAPNAKLVGLGSGEAIAILTAVQAYDWILTHHEEYDIRVVSNSWGSSGGSLNLVNPVVMATHEAYKKGILSIFAAGNDGGYDILNPYSLAPWVISVAAGDTSGNLADFSSRGLPGDEFKHPDITAPGVDIYAARCHCGGTSALDPFPNPVNPAYTPHYTSKSGTSMATPHVSGAAALLISRNPQLSPDQLIDLLTNTATPMPGYSQFEAGTGYLDAYAAYTTSLNTTGNLADFLADPSARAYSIEGLLPEVGDGIAFRETVHEGFTAAGANGVLPDEYPLPTDASSVYVEISLTWTPQESDAYDLEVIDSQGNVAISSGEGLNSPEAALFVPDPNETYIVRINPFAAVASSYTLTLREAYDPTVVVDPDPDPDPGGDTTPTPTDSAQAVVAVIDSAINPYHDFFNDGGRPYLSSAPSSVTPQVLADFGIDNDHILHLTRTGDFAADFAADAALWAGVNANELYWFAGTNVLAISFDPGSRIILPDAADDTHGVGTAAAVLDANPEAIVVFVEGITDPSEAYAFNHPLIDIVSTSYGPIGSIPLPQHINNSYVGVVENGKLHFGAADNSPSPAVQDGTAGPWWSIGVAGFEEYSSEGDQILSGNLPDFSADFTQQLPYCHDCESEIDQSVAGTSFATPRSAGTASKVLLETRRAFGHEGGIDLSGDTPLMVNGGTDYTVSNWDIRRALEEAAYFPAVVDYDPIEGLFDTAAPVLDPAPYVSVGWGVLTPDTEHGVVAEALAQLDVAGSVSRVKDSNACTYMTTLVTARHIYWDTIVITSESAGNSADPYVYCGS